MIAHSISQPSALSRSIHDSKPPSLPNTPHPKHSSPQHVVSGAPSRAIGPRCRSKARSPPSSASGERAKRIGRNPVPTRDVRCSIDVRREKQGKHVCVYIYLVTGFAIGCKNVYIYIYILDLEEKQTPAKHTKTICCTDIDFIDISICTLRSKDDMTFCGETHPQHE